MTSTNIYLQASSPYFYIIQHKETRILYAGSKWAKGCNPDEFMQHNGYTTSSPTINSIIDQEGLDSFEILRIDTNCDGLHPYDYETLFLQCLDCASSPDWYNGHNNTGKMAFGLPEFDIKAKETRLKKYGNKNYTNIEKSKQTRYEKSDGKFHSNLSLEKMKTTNQSRYDTDFPLQSPNIIEKSKKTLFDNYGVDHNSKIPEVKEKKKQTSMKNYGVEYTSQLPFLSIIQSRKTYAKNIISRVYPEFKPYY